MAQWLMWITGLLAALAAPWTSPMPISGCLAVDAAVLIIGAGFTAAARADW